MTSKQKHHVARLLEDIAREVSSVRETVEEILNEIKDNHRYFGNNQDYSLSNYENSE